MFIIQTFEYSNHYSKKDFEKWQLPNDYHCVYILENGVDAYVGETLHPIVRAYEHTVEHRKQNFKRMHIITRDFMEETPAKHYEKLLIKLMKVDGKFNIVNKNDGFKTHYKRQNEFELHFDKLWNQLAKKGLVRTKEFKFIHNSNVYKYSPYTVFTQQQTETLNHILNVLNSDETAPFRKGYKRRPIMINGSAGTGKTVIATSLFHYLRNDAIYKDKKIALVVANEQMRNILKDIFHKTKEGLRRKDVISPIDVTKQQYDIIICDEAHALRRNVNLVFYKNNFERGNDRLELDNTHDELDWILLQSKYQILFYDEKQCIRRSDIRDESVKERIQKNKYRGFRPVQLEEQMRVKAGKSYITYIYDVLYQRTTSKQVFGNYDFKLFDSFAEMRKKISEREEECGLSKLCSGYAWEWISRENKSISDIYIESIGIRWNRDKNNWVGNMDSKYEMGSVYTLRGLDLNYVGLVIGPDLYFEENQIKVNKKCLYAQDVKKGATEKELKKYILNTYALLFTRAIEGTYVYVCDEPLRNYLKSFIDPA